MQWKCVFALRIAMPPPCSDRIWILWQGPVVLELFHVIQMFEPDGVVSGKLQGFGAVGADDLTGKPGIYQVRDPADVIDVGGDFHSPIFEYISASNL
jgi:hypothetical protein